ncbi:glycine cleavage system aminomethyltransferase GcvT [Microbacterium sp. YY-01]|uniref:glycine cleavage system aminomethyltransferase GcvT n=1 Tax=Microbacterium sp. YY-01 TaxID=3421634 RepID=UPI003D17B156
MTELRTTVLYPEHEELGASFTDFGGWLMPVRYTSDLAEHHAVREAAGLFDISHMAEFTVEGPQASEYLDYALGGRLSTMSVGRAKYSLLLAEDGGVIDDVIAYRMAENSYLIISNAGNHDAVAQALPARAENFDVTVTDHSDAYALIAIQGPRAEEIMRATESIGDLSTPWNEQRYYAWSSGTFQGHDVIIARTGYTGEDGFELLIPTAGARALWRELLATGAPLGLVASGLAARDTLRLEAGMPLYGHELSRTIRPAQARLERTVAADKDLFIGKDAVTPDAGARVLVGLTAEGRRAGRAGYAILDAEGTTVGEITSGVLSPTLGYPIAMAMVDPAHAAPDTALFIDIRGKAIPATITTLPFYRRKK